MFKRITFRLESTEEGFTLIELLVVIVIIGILLAIAVPSYLGFRDRAANNAMKANLRTAVPAAEAYYADNGSYTGLNTAALAAVNQSLSPTLTVASVTATTYCLADTDGSHPWSVAGPGPTSASYKPNLTCT
jgi:type IV pilus assembly protein PilA